jgi:hypothetical protein
MAQMPEPGPGVDATGRPVVDPTQNVLDLVRAAIQRQDDLREAAERHAREVAELRSKFEEKLRRAETSRIDAIRAVDIGAVQRAEQVSAQAAATLAAQVATSAETLRAQVTASAAAARAALTAALEPIQKDIQDLRRAQYEAQGVKEQVTDTGGDMSARRSQAIAMVSVAVAATAIIVTLLVSFSR